MREELCSYIFVFSCPAPIDFGMDGKKIIGLLAQRVTANCRKNLDPAIPSLSCAVTGQSRRLETASHRAEMPILFVVHKSSLLCLFAASHLATA